MDAVVPTQPTLAGARAVPPFAVLVGSRQYRRVLQVWWQGCCVLAGLGALGLAVFITVAYPRLPHFQAVPLYISAAVLCSYGLLVPAHFRLGGLSALVCAGLLTSWLVQMFSWLAGPALSTSTSQGVIVAAASTPILFARNHALVILGSSLLGSSVILFLQGGNLSADRILILCLEASLYGALMFWFAGKLFRLGVVDRDARAEADATRARLSSADARRRNFIHNMSHELRTPLNAIIGFSEMLHVGLVGPLSNKQGEYLADIRSSGHHLLALVDDMLDIGRVEEGRLELLCAEFSLEHLVQRTVAVCRQEAARRGSSLVISGDGGGVPIVADERKVMQILFNLLSNALKFTLPSGTILVRVTMDRDWREVAVIDNGPGVAPADTDRIFRAYEQAASQDGHVGGTGLGLAVARQLAESHGGTLELRATPGGGATFVLRLPSRPGNAAPERAEADPGLLSSLGDNADPGILEPGSALERLAGADGLARIRAKIVGIAAVVETLGAGALSLLPGHVAVSWGPWSVAGGVAFGAVMLHPRMRLTANQLYALTLVAIVVTGFFVASVRPDLSPSVGAYLMMQALAAFTWFRFRRALFVGFAMATVYGIVLAYQTHDPAPIARWVLTVALVAQGAVMARWLLRLLPSVVDSEKRARRDTEMVNEQLVAASRHKSEFLASMSHELRTPLNAIIGFADGLKHELFGPLEPRQVEYVSDIETAGRDLLALINDTLDLAKADAGRLELNARSCVLGELVTAAVLPARHRAEEKGVNLRVELDAPDCTLHLDPRHMTRALDCLIQNAVAVSPEGGQVSVVGRCADDGVHIVISDSSTPRVGAGGGQIFVAFEDAEERLAEPGSRVGYALAYRLVDLNGARLAVDDHGPVGRRFTIVVPAAEPVGVAS